MVLEVTVSTLHVGGSDVWVASLHCLLHKETGLEKVVQTKLVAFNLVSKGKTACKTKVKIISKIAECAHETES